MNTALLHPSDPLWDQLLLKVPHDIYHLAAYLRVEADRVGAIAEAVAVVDGERVLFLPYLLRHCGDLYPEAEAAEGVFDITSPYGYPGPLLSDAARRDPDFTHAAVAAMLATFRKQGACSLFLRMHPILNEGQADLFPAGFVADTGETISVDLRLDEAEMMSAMRSSLRRLVRKAERYGYRARMVDARDHLDDLENVYCETMARVSATSVYFSMDHSYYAHLLEALGGRMHICMVEFEGEIASIGLYTEHDGIVQSNIGGTRDRFVHDSPAALETYFASFWFKERGNRFLHLGGGVGGARDNLHFYKSGFSKLRHPFETVRCILDERNYAALAQLRANDLGVSVETLFDAPFFPAYRVSRASLPDSSSPSGTPATRQTVTGRH